MLLCIRSIEKKKKSLNVRRMLQIMQHHASVVQSSGKPLHPVDSQKLKTKHKEFFHAEKNAFMMNTTRTLKTLQEIVG